MNLFSMLEIFFGTFLIYMYLFLLNYMLHTCLELEKQNVEL